jgi:hypothetical protein
MSKPTKERNTHSAKSNDSGVNSEEDENNIITEDTTNGNETVAFDRPTTPQDLSVGGTGYGSAAAKKERDVYSAVSTKSAPSVLESEPQILERPKSRSGAVAFEMTFDNDNFKGTDGQPMAPRRPARLAKLETRGLSREHTLAELQAKLNAAEQRRDEYERRVKNKMQKELGKVEHASMGLKREKTTLDMKVTSNEDKAAQNRERHLKEMRDKLKKKEEKAKQVRANKRRLALEAERNGATVLA